MAKECQNHFEKRFVPALGGPMSYMRADLVDNPFEEFLKFVPKGYRYIGVVPMRRGLAEVTCVWYSASVESLYFETHQAAVLVHCA